MDNQDKIFDKIRAASQKAETKDFPGMEKIWARVDEKLDQKVLKTKNKLWKKIAIAASVLLLISIAYQVIKPTSEIQIITKDIVTIDTILKMNPKPAAEAISNITIDTAKINSVLQDTKIVSNESMSDSKTNAIALQESKAEEIDQVVKLEESKKKETTKRSSGAFLGGKVYDAVVVKHKVEDKSNIELPETITANVAQTNSAPLVVINGQAMKISNNKTIGNTEKEIVSSLKNDNIESIMILKEPLYIINGVSYSEEELFGPNPTSPYAPLNRQKIEAVEILQNEEAIKKYGNKGNKGVVIITTKDGKPASPK